MKKESRSKLSIRVLLLALSIPLVVSLLLGAVFSGYMQERILKNDEEVYYNMLYGISSNLLNVDRDYNQAQLAGTQYNAFSQYVSEVTKKGYISEMEEKTASASAQTANPHCPASLFLH